MEVGQNMAGVGGQIDSTDVRSLTEHFALSVCQHHQLLAIQIQAPVSSGMLYVTL
jgi:hypothetical protein